MLTSCCGMSLKRGGSLIGIVLLTMTFVQSCNMPILMGPGLPYAILSLSKGFNFLWLILWILLFFANISLIIAAEKSRKWFILPWLIIYALFTLSLLLVLSKMKAVLMVVAVVIYGLFAYVLISLFMEIRSEELRLPRVLLNPLEECKIIDNFEK